MQRMVGQAPQLVTLLGDLSYADSYSPPGVWFDSFSNDPGKYTTGYQPAWDMWARTMQPLTSKVPMMVTPGNHELEFQ
jgi:hypothetical protein